MGTTKVDLRSASASRGRAVSKGPRLPIFTRLHFHKDPSAFPRLSCPFLFVLARMETKGPTDPANLSPRSQLVAGRDVRR